jgi:PAS domain S-box-containing protein
LEDIYDLTYIRKDGSRFPAVVSVTALRDGQGGIIGYLLIGTDNTARQRIEEERKAALRELNDVKAAIDQHAIVAITDRKGKITYVNDKFCRISKYPREELLGQDHRIINSEFHSKEFMKNLWQTISEGRVWKGEIKNKAKDGSFYWVDVTIVPYLGENQKPIQYIAIRTDITERKLAEEVSARFAAMVEFSDDAILSKTLDGRITSWNPGAAKLFGYPAAEVIGKTMQSFIPPERPDEEVEILARIAGGENIQHFETMRVRKDRTRIDVSVTISPIKDGQGKVIGVSKIARDNTERKRFEHALQQTNVELEHARRMAEQANRAKSEFISSMSHELRTPLNGIIGFTEFLIDEKPGPLRPKQKEYLGDVLNSGRHLLQLINDVLDLAKVEAGKMELHLETFPVRKAVEEVTAVIQGIANKKQIAIAIEIGPDLDAVMLDQHKFKQILYNLLSNAIKFSDDGGQVSIRARRLDTQQLEIAIRDAGIGIKTEDIGRLFNNFEQLDSGTARRFEGTGLGLALTKKLIEFQGGCIRVESQPAHGSIFTVVLPVEIKKEGTS